MARRLVVEIIGDATSLERAAEQSAVALDQVKLGAAQAAESRINASQILEGVRGISADALVAARELDEVKLTVTTAAESIAAGDAIKANIHSIGDAADFAAAKIALLRAAMSAHLHSFGAGAGGGGGALSGMGWGGGMFGMAGFGSLLALAGFGAEHALFTGAGVAGSAVGGLLGGGLLGLGALGTMAVGMGTDLTGSLQATKDIQATAKAADALQTAIQTYGKSSTQAATAQKQLNATLAGFQPIARGAIASAAQTAGAFGDMFKQVTGQAVKTAAQIDQQVMQVGMKFLPMIGKFAAENMRIIKEGIQPLLAWMQSGAFSGPGMGGGLGIFTNLEQIFQRNLPTSISALSQGFELLAKVIDVAAQHTGGFMQTINRVLTRLNGPDFAGVTRVVNTLIGLFGDLMHLVGALGSGLIDLFKPAAGAGAAIIQTITQLIELTDKWLSSTGTQNVLTNLFNVHLQEVIQGVFGVLKAGWPILEQIATGFLQLDTAVSAVATGPLKLIGAILKALTEIPLASKVIGWAAAIAILASALRTTLVATNPLLLAITSLVVVSGVIYDHWRSWGPLLLPLAVAIGAVTAALTASKIAALSAAVVDGTLTVAMGALAVAEGVATAATAAFGAALDLALGPFGLILAAIAALAVAAYEIYKHWDEIKRAFNEGIAYVEKHWRGFLAGLATDAAGPLGLVVAYVATHWQAIEHATQAIWNSISSFFSGVWRGIKETASSTLNQIEGVIRGAASTLENAARFVANAIIKGIVDPLLNLGGELLHKLEDGINTAVHLTASFAAGIAGSIGSALVDGILGGLGGLVSAVGSSLKNGLMGAVHWAGGLLHGSGDFQFTRHLIGEPMMQGICDGIADNASLVATSIVKVLGSLVNSVITTLGADVPRLATAFATTVTTSALQGISAAIAAISKLLPAWAQHVGFAAPTGTYYTASGAPLASSFIQSAIQASLAANPNASPGGYMGPVPMSSYAIPGGPTTALAAKNTGVTFAPQINVSGSLMGSTPAEIAQSLKLPMRDALMSIGRVEPSIFHGLA